MKALAVVLLFLVATPSPELRYFQYQRPLSVTNRQDAQTCVELDPSLYAHAAKNLSDVRVYQDGQIEVPYVVRASPPAASNLPVLAPYNVGLREQKTVFDAEMPSGSYSELSLDIREKDFLATVSVFGSQSPTDNKGTKLGDFPIFDFSKQSLGRSTVLRLGGTNFRYLHFELNGNLKPEQVSGVRVEKTPELEQKYLIVSESKQGSQKDRDTVFDFTVPAHVPIEQIMFQVGSEVKNFHRQVSLHVEGSSDAQKTAQEAVFYPVDSNQEILRFNREQNGVQLHEEQLTVPAPLAVFEGTTKWKVTIRNGDDRPLPVLSVKLLMVSRKLCYEGQPNGSYALFYGDTALQHPDYDYAKFFVLSDKASVAALGPEQKNPLYVPRPDSRPFTERHRVLLWIALLVVVSVLGLVSFQIAKQTKPEL